MHRTHTNPHTGQYGEPVYVFEAIVLAGTLFSLLQKSILMPELCLNIILGNGLAADTTY